MLRAGLAGASHPLPLGAHRWAWACMPAAASRERPAQSSLRVDSRAAVGRAVPKRVTPAPTHCARRCPRGGRGPGLCTCAGSRGPGSRLAVRVCVLRSLSGRAWRGLLLRETPGVSAVLALSPLSLFLPRLFLSSSVFLFELGLCTASHPCAVCTSRHPSHRLPCHWCMAGRQAMLPV